MSTSTPTLEALRASEVLSDLDLHFADAMCRLANERDERVRLGAALVSRQTQAGHVCLELRRLCQGALVLTAGDGSSVEAALPDYETWREALAASPLVSSESTIAPLCLDGEGRLYLRRYFDHERALVTDLLERAKRSELPVREHLLREGLDRLFGAEPRRATVQADARQLGLFDAQAAPAGEPDLQRAAAERAVRRPLCVISGGPGTGKTSTVVKILALLVERAQADPTSAMPRVLLLAPTGKAAARLSEAIGHATGGLRCDEAVRAAIPRDASTIHRALGGSQTGGRRFRHDRGNRLAADVVVVDEASMVDLALMARLLEAVPRNARVILLGDRNQLASVEAGAVLGDICGAGLGEAGQRADISRSIVVLERSYRYAEDSGIRALAGAINAGDAARALEILRDPRLPDVTLCETPAGSPVPAELFDAALERFAPYFDARGAQAKLAQLGRFRVLCAHRRGPHGQVAVNAAIEARLREDGLIDARSERYAGRPILITQNDHQARLFNGDVGVLAEDAADSRRIVACFGGDGKLRTVAVARLPPHESVYAMSVHKSQGSELDEVAVLLPSEPSPVLSRELLYTAVTRARSRVVLYAPVEVFTRAVETAVDRASGLRAALYGR